MATNQILKISFLAFVFLLAFSLGAQAVANQPIPCQYEEYLQETYGVSSVEELRLRYEREADVQRYGTSTYEIDLSQQEAYPWWTILCGGGLYINCE